MHQRNHWVLGLLVLLMSVGLGKCLTMEKPYERALPSSAIMGAEIVALERLSPRRIRYKLKIEPRTGDAFETPWRDLTKRYRTKNMRQGMQMLVYVPHDKPRSWVWLPSYQQHLTYLQEEPKNIPKKRTYQARVHKQRIVLMHSKHTVNTYCEYRVRLRGRNGNARLSKWARIPCLAGDMHPMHSQNVVTIMQSTTNPEVWARVAPKEKP